MRSLLLLLLLWPARLVVSSDVSKTTFDAQLHLAGEADGFVAALDQSGGSTPKALKLYGIPDDDYVAGEETMFDQVHQLRSRIMTSKCFHGDQGVLGAILFADTIDRTVDGIPTARYLWESKRVIPFLKVDAGLADEANGVQLMKPIPELDILLKRGKDAGIFGTKMRSLIKTDNSNGIKAVADQQFEIGKQIIAAGLIPILEPEVDIYSNKKKECEKLLKANLLEHLNLLGENDKVILKLSLPTIENHYKECIDHPKCIRVFALSGGYSRDEANEILAKNIGMIGSFSRALSEGLQHSMGDEYFEQTLDSAIQSIFEASKA